jgi:nanoRNase/pAp phosphatase (c-di-AMP/oligoRNAs hydrolase)
VEVAVAIKTYPDGKLTGKIRSSKPISDQLAGFFGGGGHPYAAGFRIYDDYENVLPDLIGATMKLL